MTRIDRIKVEIDFYKTIIISVFFGTMVALLIYMQTSGVYGIYIVSGMVVLGISAISFTKKLRSLLDELEKL